MLIQNDYLKDGMPTYVEKGIQTKHHLPTTGFKPRFEILRNHDTKLGRSSPRRLTFNPVSTPLTGCTGIVFPLD